MKKPSFSLRMGLSFFLLLIYMAISIKSETGTLTRLICFLLAGCPKNFLATFCINWGTGNILRIVKFMVGVTIRLGSTGQWALNKCYFLSTCVEGELLAISGEHLDFGFLCLLPLG